MKYWIVAKFLFQNALRHTPAREHSFWDVRIGDSLRADPGDTRRRDGHRTGAAARAVSATQAEAGSHERSVRTATPVTLVAAVRKRYQEI